MQYALNGSSDNSLDTHRCWRERPNTVMEEIAREADLDEVARRCPQSFAPFLEELRAVASPARATPGTTKRRGK